MRTKLTMGSKLVGGAAAMFVLAGIQGFFGLSTTNRFKEQFDNAVEKTVKKILLAGDIDLARMEMVSAQRGIVLASYAKDKATLEKSEREYQQSAESVQKNLDAIRSLLVNEEGRARTAEIVANLSQWRS